MIQLQLTPEMFGCSAKGSVGCKGHGPGEENLDGGNPGANRSKERQETERTQCGMRLWIQHHSLSSVSSSSLQPYGL